jgi:excinuclease UvrABC nuclease subunit
MARAKGTAPRLTRKRKLNAENVAAVPAARGVYVLYGSQGAPAYVGKRDDLRAGLDGQLKTGRVPAVAFAYALAKTDAQAGELERALIRDLTPRFNLHDVA